MTDAQRTATYIFIFAVLLFVGSSGSSEVNNSLLSDAFLKQAKDVEALHKLFKKPSLQPKESMPLIGTYTLSKNSRVCVMARLGVEFMVKENESGVVSYMSTLRMLLEPELSCKQCQGKSYPGILNHTILFKTPKNKSFKCQSVTSLQVAKNLTIKLIPLQIQAFDISMNAFGKETVCWADYFKRTFPIIMGAVVAGIILIAVLVYVLKREHRSRGYERL